MNGIETYVNCTCRRLFGEYGLNFMLPINGPIQETDGAILIFFCFF